LYNSRPVSVVQIVKVLHDSHAVAKLSNVWTFLVICITLRIHIISMVLQCCDLCHYGTAMISITFMPLMIFVLMTLLTRIIVPIFLLYTFAEQGNWVRFHAVKQICHMIYRRECCLSLHAVSLPSFGSFGRSFIVYHLNPKSFTR
ncbi:unnamed protein product, partial [Amoebophrya sp. A25]